MKSAATCRSKFTAKGRRSFNGRRIKQREAGLVRDRPLGQPVARSHSRCARRHCPPYRSHDRVCELGSLHDHATQDLIRRGDTIGCFYIRIARDRLLLRKLWRGMPPDRLARGGRLRISRHGVVARAAAYPFDYPASSGLMAIRMTAASADGRHAAKTHGIMVYQEDVTKVAMALADFPLEDADQLRKVISKKHKSRQLRGLLPAVLPRAPPATERSPDTIDKIWTMIMSFAGYSFCKTPLASYAQVSF